MLELEGVLLETVLYHTVLLEADSYYTQKYIVLPSFLPLLSPAASWHLHQHLARSRLCDSEPSPLPSNTTEDENLNNKLIHETQLSL